ncbi:MAG: 50S ribosomal protein L32 [Dehalococcoidia bacterium]|nr:50S ribosomal protein L32 [Dehalococcoidia bacterium]
MPPLPKKKHGISRSGRRKSLFAGKWVGRLPSLSVCPQCRQAKLSHQVCRHCGYYKGREVIAPKGSAEQP